MLEVSEEFKERVNTPGRIIDCKLEFSDKILSKDIIKDIKIEDSILTGDEFTVGTFISTKSNISIISKEYEESYEGKTFTLYLGIDINGNVEYTNQGIFTVKEEKRSGQVTTLTCEDNTNIFDVKFDLAITYPIRLKDLITKICTKVGLTLKGDFYNCNYIIKEDPQLDENTTCRKVIQAIAELSCGYARVNNENKLEIFNLLKPNIGTVFSGEIPSGATTDVRQEVVTVINLDNNNTFTFDNSKTATETITKVAVMTNNIYSEYGFDDGKCYVVDNNILISGVENKELSATLYNMLNGVSYKQVNIKWMGNLYNQCGDLISIYDGNVFHETYLMTRKVNYNGGLTEEYSASGKSKEKDKTKAEGNIKQQVRKAKIEINILNDEIVTKVTADEACSAVVQKADELNISINGKLKGKTYNFDGNGFSIGDPNSGDSVKHTNNESVYTFQDGSKVVIGKDGFYNLIGSSKTEYYHLSYTTEVTVTTNPDGTFGFTVMLPSEFKDKKYNTVAIITDCYIPPNYLGIMMRAGAWVYKAYGDGVVINGQCAMNYLHIVKEDSESVYYGCSKNMSNSGRPPGGVSVTVQITVTA